MVELSKVFIVNYKRVAFKKGTPITDVKIQLMQEGIFSIVSDSSRRAPVLRPKVSKTLFGPVNFSF